MGRNGCGKSTLVGVISGIIAQDAGEVLLNACPAPGRNESAKWRQLVACVYQKPTVVPTLSTAENMFLGSLPRSRWGTVKWDEIWRQSQEVLREWGVETDVREDVSLLSVDERQVVEIVRALLLGTRFVILDEPTAGLQAGEVTRLFERIRALQAAGVAFLYISHHLDEVFELSQRVTILRDGRWVATRETGDINKDELVAYMVGTQATLQTPKGESSTCVIDREAAPALEVRNLTIERVVQDINLSVCPGECVGLAGHTGSGSAQVADCVAGLLPYQQGEIKVKSRRIAPGKPDNAITAGVGFVPQDRYTRGFVHCMSILDNVTMPVHGRLGRAGIVFPSRQTKLADDLIRELDVKLESSSQEMTQLSGGNQQKVTLGRALSSNPDILVLVNPTAGIDVASKATILSAVRDEQNRGKGVLLVSDEEEDLRVCDRVLVMFRGRVVKEFGSRWDEKDLVRALEGWAGDND